MCTKHDPLHNNIYDQITIVFIIHWHHSTCRHDYFGLRHEAVEYNVARYIYNGCFTMQSSTISAHIPTVHLEQTITKD